MLLAKITSFASECPIIASHTEGTELSLSETVQLRDCAVHDLLVDAKRRASPVRDRETVRGASRHIDAQVLVRLGTLADHYRRVSQWRQGFG